MCGVVWVRLLLHRNLTLGDRVDYTYMARVNCYTIDPITLEELEPHLKHGVRHTISLPTNSINEALFHFNELVHRYRFDETDSPDDTCLGWSDMVLQDKCYMLANGHKLVNYQRVFANVAQSTLFTVLAPYGTERVKVSFTPIYVPKSVYSFAVRFFRTDGRNLYCKSGEVKTFKHWDAVPRTDALTRSVSWRKSAGSRTFYRAVCMREQAGAVIKDVAEKFPMINMPHKVDVGVSVTSLVYDVRDKGAELKEFLASEHDVSCQFMARSTDWPQRKKYETYVYKLNQSLKQEYDVFCRIFNRKNTTNDTVSL